MIETVNDGTVLDVARAVRSGTVSAVTMADRALAAIDAKNPALTAFVHVDADAALAAAHTIDRMIRDGSDPGPLAGVPFGVKDFEDCTGMPTRCGSLLAADTPPARNDSPPVARLRAAGAIPIGKTAMSEFGLDSATNTKAHGVTRNPWNLQHTPGGSSGGSAAAVSAGMVPFATAADGGGSTRGPAANCGLVGLKPTHGLIGAAAASDFGVHGALTCDVLSTARLLDVMAGPTPEDRTSMLAGRSVNYEALAGNLDIAGIRVAWTPDMGHAVVEPEVAAIAEEAARRLVRAANLQLQPALVRTVSAFDSWVNHTAALLRGGLELDGHWPARRDDLSDIVRTFFDGVDRITPRALALAARQRQRIEADMTQVFEEVDVVLSPTSACAPWAADGPYPTIIAGQDATKTGPDSMMMIANFCWLPAISVPAGFTSLGLPIGLQLMARRGNDDVVLRLARLLEIELDWPHHPPS
jgi:aspartyl-tRNA(Asn)/glutamyl-tRNA(Gln) amidotransferase subunit A